MFKRLSFLIVLFALISGVVSTSANAGSKYANWVRHGDTYVVKGDFGGESQWAVELGNRVAANGADALWPALAAR